MSAAATAVAPATSLISTANVAASPGTTILGLGFLGQLLNSLAASGLPTTGQGWAQFAITAAMGAAGIFMRS